MVAPGGGEVALVGVGVRGAAVGGVAEALMGDWVEGFLYGALLAGLAVFAAFGFAWPSSHHIIVEQNDKGIVCHPNNFYPSYSCDSILVALGPRSNVAEVKK